MQYDTCNASAGSGQSVFFGYCIPGIADPLDTIIVQLILSAPLPSVVNFVNNNLFYFTSMFHMSIISSIGVGISKLAVLVPN